MFHYDRLNYLVEEIANYSPLAVQSHRYLKLAPAVASIPPPLHSLNVLQHNDNLFGKSLILMHQQVHCTSYFMRKNSPKRLIRIPFLSLSLSVYHRSSCDDFTGGSRSNNRLLLASSSLEI